MRAVNRSTTVPARRTCRDGLAKRHHTKHRKQNIPGETHEQQLNNKKLQSHSPHRNAKTRTQTIQIHTSVNTKIEQHRKAQQRKSEAAREKPKMSIHIRLQIQEHTNTSQTQQCHANTPTRALYTRHMTSIRIKSPQHTSQLANQWRGNYNHSKITKHVP